MVLIVCVQIIPIKHFAKLETRSVFTWFLLGGPVSRLFHHYQLWSWFAIDWNRFCDQFDKQFAGIILYDSTIAKSENRVLFSISCIESMSVIVFAKWLPVLILQEQTFFDLLTHPFLRVTSRSNLRNLLYKFYNSNLYRVYQTARAVRTVAKLK